MFGSGNVVGHSATKTSASRAQNAGGVNSVTLLLKKGCPLVKEMLRNDIIKCITYKSIIQLLFQQNALVY
jgi:hypothetical protein